MAHTICGIDLGAFSVKFVGRYHDTLRRGPNGWQFVERRVAYVDPVVS